MNLKRELAIYKNTLLPISYLTTTHDKVGAAMWVLKFRLNFTFPGCVNARIKELARSQNLWIVKIGTHLQRSRN